VASAQHGTITGRQLSAAGVGPYRRAVLVERGLLVHSARDLFSLPGAEPAWPHLLWRALLLAGGQAVASHRSAAALWNLDGVSPGAIDVISLDGRRSSRIATHRPSGISEADVVRHRGFPLTTVGRTLTDLGQLTDDDTLERSMECGLRRGDVGVDELRDRAARAGRGQTGPAALRRVLDRRPAGAVPTESDAETLFLQVARRAGFPTPDRQYTLLVGGKRIRLDFAWPSIRLAVEIDGAATHANADALGRDLRRQNVLVLGWLVQRFTWEDVARYPADVVDALGKAWGYATLRLASH
jgi:very-short-patch-repair endonuclease